jgi:hypothetical protein
MFLLIFYSKSDNTHEQPRLHPKLIRPTRVIRDSDLNAPHRVVF